MSSPTKFYTSLSQLTATLDDPGDSDPAIFTRCVANVLTETYPSVKVSKSVSEGVNATTDDIGPPERFELERYAIEDHGDKYTISVEAQYEDMLPYTYPGETVSRPPTPRDYGPVLVTYQLRGEAHRTASHVHADVFAFRGTYEEYTVPAEESE